MAFGVRAIFISFDAKKRKTKSNLENIVRFHCIMGSIWRRTHFRTCVPHFFNLKILFEKVRFNRLRWAI